MLRSLFSSSFFFFFFSIAYIPSLCTASPPRIIGISQRHDSSTPHIQLNNPNPPYTAADVAAQARENVPFPRPDAAAQAKEHILSPRGNSDSTAPADRAEIGGILLATRPDYDGFVLVVVNEYQQLSFVRQSVCPVALLPAAYEWLATTTIKCRALPTIDAMVTRQTPLPLDALRTLRTYVEEMDFHGGYKHTLTMHMRVIVDRKLLLSFQGDRAPDRTRDRAFVLFRTEKDEWTCENTGWPMEEDCAWVRPAEKSNAIQPYSWAEARWPSWEIVG